MMAAEVLYGTQDDSLVMSEKVQSLAGCIYREFEDMIGTYGDNVIKGLMPHIVSVLENLNHAYREKQEHEVENELLRVENENLKKQFEKEKQMRKSSEQKYLEGDDLLEEEKKLHQQATEVLESNLRRLEVKTKNLQEQILRNEERETEMKTEYSKLHQRYNEILKKHADYVERYKIQNEKDFASPNRSLPLLPVLKHVNGAISKELSTRQDLTFDLQQTDDTEGNNQDVTTALKNELNNEKNRNDSSVPEENIVNLPNDNGNIAEKTDDIPESDNKVDNFDGNMAAKDDSENNLNEDDLKSREDGIASGKDVADGSLTVDSLWVADEVGGEWVAEENQDAGVDECLLATYGGSGGNILSLTSVGYDESAEGFRDDDPSHQYSSFGGKLEKESSIYDELSQQDSKALGEMDGGINLVAEVEKLIKENNELLETKNALNIVKDDLITRVDELSGEQELLQDEISALQSARERQLNRISELEEEVKRTKEELEKASKEDEGDDKRCFTRIDMTRVVMERNQFKEKLMELQEAVRLAEMLRASKDHPDLIKTSKKKSSSFWNFFSALVNGNDDPPKQVPKQSTSSSSSKPPTVI